MKYVAFVDMLGFKDGISDISHDDAKNIIMHFNQEIYNLWSSLGFKGDPDIQGRTFSDSIIVSTNDTKDKNLRKLLTFLIELYKVSIIKCGLLLRGGIAVGDYDDIKSVEFDNLQKGIVVGNAFIDAYILESKENIKASKILFKQEVNTKIDKRLHGFVTKRVKSDLNGISIYELKWGDITFLVENNYESLNKYIDMGCQSKWIPHYYGTLETFLIAESKEDKSDIFIKIIDRIKKEYDYNHLDDFIENFMKSECSPYLKKSFLGFIRRKL